MTPTQALRVLYVVGARPNFVKVAPVVAAGEAWNRAADPATVTFEQTLVHTGQHYDAALSDIFFDQLGLPEPDVSLGVGSGSQAVQTARLLEALEPVVLERRPDLVVVPGDVNSTLAASLVAAKLHVPLAHLEAGLRSGDRQMPEEINRIVADHCADLLWAPTGSSTPTTTPGSSRRSAGPANVSGRRRRSRCGTGTRGRGSSPRSRSGRQADSVQCAGTYPLHESGAGACREVDGGIVEREKYRYRPREATHDAGQALEQVSVVIPEDVRERLGVKPGQVFEVFALDGQVVVAVPARPISESFGMFPGIDTTVERDDEDRL